MSGQRLKNKTVIITGASGGIGEAMALRVAREGAFPILVARSTDKLQSVRQAILDRYQIDAAIYSLDIGQLDQVNTVFNTIVTAHPKIDVLINNAGFGVFDYFPEASLNEAREMFGVNVLGMMACTQAVLPGMITNQSGHIINIGSIAGKLSTPKSTIYSATKHAVLGFTNGLRMEVADQSIRVTAVNPGPVQTNFFSRADPDGTYLENVHHFMITPGQVAEKVVKVIGKNRREINLPWTMSAGAKLYQFFPALIEKVAGPMLRKK